MRALARRFGEDEALGPDRHVPRPGPGPHGRRCGQPRPAGRRWLREAEVDERVINGVLAHAYEDTAPT